VTGVAKSLPGSRARRLPPASNVARLATPLPRWSPRMRPSSVTLLIATIVLASAQATSGDLEAIHLTGSLARTRSLEPLPQKSSTWPATELEFITQADDFYVAPYRDNHVTLGIPNWTWSVAVDGELYVRAYNGIRAGWYQSALRERAGQITAAGMKKLVAFEPVQGPI